LIHRYLLGPLAPCKLKDQIDIIRHERRLWRKSFQKTENLLRFNGAIARKKKVGDFIQGWLEIRNAALDLGNVGVRLKVGIKHLRNREIDLGLHNRIGVSAVCS